MSARRQVEQSFGAWLRRQRMVLDLTQAELAQQIGCSTVTIKKLEAEQRRPSKQLSELLADVLNVAPGERARFLRFARGDPFATSHQTTLPERLQTQVVRHNLPLQLTSFIGREKDLADVGHLIRTARLVTLSGVGGNGKTRLALQVANNCVEQFDWVWLVELAGLTDPFLVPSAVATALGLREQPVRLARDLLLDYLQDKQLLLLLDNCEHLVAACAELANAILRVCPLVHIVATSRERLKVAGEINYVVPSLTLPDRQSLQRVESVASSEAGQLFVERARAAIPQFQLTANNAAAVGEICRRLDGIPLALELAAARIRMLAPEHIALHLDHRFRLLTDGNRVAVPKQQTLRASIDWSYELLGLAEQALLRRLAVFAGGWTLLAAEAIAGNTIIVAADVLGLLAHLVDKSLVLANVWESEMGSRYEMLETVRQFGLETLVASGELEAVQRLHVAYYLELAEQAEPALTSTQQPVTLRQLELEHDNLRAALAYSQTSGETEHVLRLAGALWRFWFLRGHFSEAQEWLRPALESSNAAPVVRAKALVGLAFFANFRGDNPESARVAAEGLRFARQCGDRQLMAFALSLLGEAHWQVDALNSAELELKESLSLAREAGNDWLIAFALNETAESARRQGDVNHAAELAADSLALARTVGDDWLIAFSLFRLGCMATEQHQFEIARALHSEGLAIRRQLADRLGIAYALLGLADAARAQGDILTALEHTQERLAIERGLNNKEGVAHVLSDMGWMALDQDDYARARDHFEESLAICREIEFHWCIAAQLHNVATVLNAQGEHALARARLEESLAIWRDRALTGNMGPLVLYSLGRLAYHEADYETAWKHATASLRGFEEIADQADTALALLAIGDIKAARSQPKYAVRLWGAADALRANVANALRRWERGDHEHAIDTCATALGDEMFGATWAEGQTMTAQLAISLALES